MKKSFLIGALILSMGAFIAKLLGAFYRIPLTNIIGAEGIGLYQMVFPLYSLLLIASSAGIPNAIARMVSEKIAVGDNAGARFIFKSALILMLILGAICSALILIFGGVIAGIQGNSGASIAYTVISPAIILSASIAAFRGYFQGRQNMVPSSISLCTEQFAKIIFGLYFANLWLPRGIEFGVAGAILGVTISEFIAFIVISIQYYFYNRKEKHKLKNKTSAALIEVANDNLNSDQSLKKYKFSDYFHMTIKVFKVAFPITLGSMILPLTLLIDSLLIINILIKTGYSSTVATSLFGLQTGIVNSLLGLPQVISLSIATAIVPAISRLNVVKNNTDINEAKEEISLKVRLSIKIAWLIALPCFVGFIIFAPEIINLLYSGGLNNSVIPEFNIAANLLKLASVNIVYIAFLQVFTTTLQALKKSYVPLVNLIIAGLIKIILNVILIRVPTINIQGAVIADIACYFTACTLNLLYLRRLVYMKINILKFFVLPVLSAAFMAVAAYVSNSILSSHINANLALIISIGVGAAVYMIALFFSNIFEESEKVYIPMLRKQHAK